MKEIIYRFYMAISKTYWQWMGGRRIQVFGNSLIITEDTVFPSYRTHPLPAGSHKSRIVRHADFVQAHALADFIHQAKRPLAVVEVGAHHGAYEVLLGKLLREHGGRLIALEPNPISFEILCRNIDINGLADIVRCMKAGVSDKTGELRISDDGSQSQLIIEGQGELIEVKTLAQIPTEQDLHMVDLLVIDVEGAELPVLVGFQWDDLPLPRIFCELHPYAWKDFGYTGQDFSGFLSKKFLRCIDMYLTEHDIFNAPDYIWPTLLMR